MRNLLYQMVVSVKFLKLLMTEVLAFLIVIKLFIDLRSGLSIYFLSVLCRNLLVDQ